MSKKPPLLESAPAPAFEVQVMFTAIGVVPFRALNCETFSDVLVLLHREDPNDQYFDGVSESGQATRIYQHGIAMVTERHAPKKGGILVPNTQRFDS